MAVAVKWPFSTCSSPGGESNSSQQGGEEVGGNSEADGPPVHILAGHMGQCTGPYLKDGLIH